MKTYSAELNKSFGGIPFGAPAALVEQTFGKPDETTELDSGDGSLSPVWHYWALGFSIFFDADQPDRFCSVEVDSSVLMELHSRAVFRENEDGIKSFMNELGYGNPEEEEHEWGEKRVTFDDAGVDYYFEKGILVSINFGAIF
jgi:hypothetical protein